MVPSQRMQLLEMEDILQQHVVAPHGVSVVLFGLQDVFHF